MTQRDMKLKQSQKILAEKVQNDMFYDDSTQQPLFHPIISHENPRKRPENMDVYTHLYGMRNHKQMKTQNELTNQKLEQINNHAKSSDNSSRMQDQIQNQKLEKVFTFFDRDNDGFVTNTDIELAVSELDDDMFALMEQLIRESKQGEINLNKQEFLTSMNFLLKNSIIPEKHTILRKFVKGLISDASNSENSLIKKGFLSKFSNNNLSFQPQINQRSKLITQAKAHNDGYGSWHERLNSYQTNNMRYAKAQNDVQDHETGNDENSVLYSQN